MAKLIANNLEKLLIDKNIKNSKRVSIKCFKDGSIDSDRFTYSFSKLYDESISLIMDSLTDNTEAKEYILRRTTNKTNFILSIDNKSVRFYLDSNFKLNKVSMISIEITGDKFKVKEYKHEEFYDIYTFFEDVLQIVDKNSFLTRSDGQNYLRIVKYPKPEFYFRFCDEEIFKEFIYKNHKTPVWFQYSEESFTFYFKCT